MLLEDYFVCKILHFGCNGSRRPLHYITSLSAAIMYQKYVSVSLTVSENSKF